MNQLNLGIRAHDVDMDSLGSLSDKLGKYPLKHIQLAPMKSFGNHYNNIFSFTKGTARTIQNTLNKQDVSISVLGSYVNLSSRDLETRQKAVQIFKHNLLLAHDFNASMVASETGSITKGYTLENYTDEAYDNTLDSMKQIMPVAEKLGVVVAIEAGINHPIHNAQMLRKLLDDVNSPNLKIILDVANLMNPDNYENQDEIIDEAFALYGDDLQALHLKDFVYDGEWIKFVPFGTGNLNYGRILNYIKEHKPNLFCLLEGTQAPYITQAIALLHSTYQNL